MSSFLFVLICEHITIVKSVFHLIKMLPYDESLESCKICKGRNRKKYSFIFLSQKSRFQNVFLVTACNFTLRNLRQYYKNHQRKHNCCSIVYKAKKIRKQYKRDARQKKSCMTRVNNVCIVSSNSDTNLVLFSESLSVKMNLMCRCRDE